MGEAGTSMAAIYTVLMTLVFYVGLYPLLFVLSIPRYLAPGLGGFLRKLWVVADGMTIGEIREVVGDRWWSHASLIISCDPPAMRIDHAYPVGSDNGPPTVWMDLDGITREEVLRLARQWPWAGREWINYVPPSAFGVSLDAVRVRRVRWAWLI